MKEQIKDLKKTIVREADDNIMQDLVDLTRVMIEEMRAIRKALEEKNSGIGTLPGLPQPQPVPMPQSPTPYQPWGTGTNPNPYTTETDWSDLNDKYMQKSKKMTGEWSG